jgi:DNA-binding SARP family transcriptional activator/tetratricopeptide (TPR) repeat protein
MTDTPRSMIHLRTLGPVDLVVDDGSGIRAILAQPKRLALLVFLVVGGKDGFQRRDQLLALFWPERDTNQARAALNRAIYHLRQFLGDGIVLSRGDEEIGIARERLWCDATAFDDAIASGDYRTAVDLYRADFLEGFFVSDAPGFERWLEEERRRLRTAACDAGSAVSDAADAAGNRSEAIRWARWTAARSPLEEAGIQRLVRLLDRAGDRAGAVVVYEAFARRLAEELDLSPSPETEALVAAVRGRHQAGPDFGARSPSAERAADAPLDAVLAPAEPQKPGRSTANPSKRRLRPPVVAAIAAAVVVASSALIALRQTSIPFEDRGWVLIGDFENSTGDPSFDRTLDLALATAMRQSTRINVVPRSDIRATLQRMRRSPADSQLTESVAIEVARREAVPVVIIGRIAALGTTYHVTLRAIDAATGRERRSLQATAEQKSAVIATLDALGVRLRRDLGESATRITKGIPLPKATTESVEALEKYAAGLRAMDAALYPEAAVLLQAAIRLDSNFAMAHGALGQVFYGALWRADGDRHFNRALMLADRLTERERLSIQIQAAGSRGNRAEAMRLLRAYLTEFPDDQRGWAQLGYESFRSQSPREALAAYESAARIRPLQAADWTNIASTYATLGLNDSTLIAYGRAFEMDPALETWAYNNNQYGKALVFAGRLDAAAATFAKMLPKSAIDRMRGLRSLAHLDLYRGNYDAGIARMTEATVIAEEQHEPVSEWRNRMMLAAALEESGQQAAARRERLRVAAAFTDRNFPPRLLLYLGKPLARDGEISRSMSVLDTLRARARTDNPQDQSDLAVLEGEVAVARGHLTEAIEHLKRAFHLDSTKYALESLAYATAASGDLRAAAGLYNRLATGDEFGWEPQQYWRFARYWLGVVQERRGDTRLALESYRRFVHDWPGADASLPVVRDAQRRVERLRAHAE